MKRLAIIGGGDLGKQIAHHASLCGYKVIGFFDDYADDPMGRIDDISRKYSDGDFDELMIGIGYKHMSVRAELFSRFSGEIPFAKVVHPSVVVDPSCEIGEGSLIYPGCILDMNVKIGVNVSLNAGCVIAHDSTVGDHSMLSPGVVVSGFVNIEKGVNLGTGTKVIDNISVGRNVKTGAGAVIAENLEEPGLYVGVPARFKKSL